MLLQVAEVFYYAQKAILHPTAPLFDQETQTLKPRCVRALKRIFILCDHDRDGALNDPELNDFQVSQFDLSFSPVVNMYTEMHWPELPFTRELVAEGWSLGSLLHVECIKAVVFHHIMQQCTTTGCIPLYRMPHIITWKPCSAHESL